MPLSWEEKRKIDSDLENARWLSNLSRPSGGSDFDEEEWLREKGYSRSNELKRDPNHWTNFFLNQESPGSIDDVEIN